MRTLEYEVRAKQLQEVEKKLSGAQGSLSGFDQLSKSLDSVSVATGKFTSNLKKLEDQFRATGAAKDAFIQNLKTLQSLFNNMARINISGQAQQPRVLLGPNGFPLPSSLTPLNGSFSQFVQNQSRTPDSRLNWNFSRLVNGMRPNQAKLAQEMALEKGFFNPNRVFQNKGALSSVALTGLLGSPLEALGGFIGGSIGKGDLGGHTGVLLGAVAVQGFTRAVEAIISPLREASQAALEFERGVSATRAVLTQSTDVYQGGVRLFGTSAINAQTQRATSLQLAARRALLPLGIGGETEAALSNAFIQARSGQGFIPNEGTVGKFLGRLGAFTQLAAPDLTSSSTRLFKDVSDLFQNPSRAGNTRLGAALRPITPELFSGKKLNDEELDKATKKLDAYVDALRNGNTYLTQRIQIEGQLQSNQLQIGEALNEALIPGLKALNDELRNPENVKGFINLAKGIGGFTSEAIKWGIQFVDSMRDIGSEFKDINRGTGSRLGMATAAAADYGTLGLFNFTGQANDEYAQEQTEGQRAQNDNALAALNKRRGIKGLLPLQGEDTLNTGITSALNAQTGFYNQLSPYGITQEGRADLNYNVNKNPFAGLAGAELSQKNIFDPNNPYVKSLTANGNKHTFTSKIGLLAAAFSGVNNPNDVQGFNGGKDQLAEERIKSSQDLLNHLEVVRQAKSSTFTEDLAGQLGLAGSNRQYYGREVKAQQAVVDTLKSQQEDAAIKGGQKLHDITHQLNQEENKLAELRAKETNAINAQAQALINISNLQTRGIDTFNAAGRGRAAGAQISASGRNIQTLTSLYNQETDPDRRAELQAQIREESVKINQSQRQQQLNPIESQQELVNFSLAIKSLKDFPEDAKFLVQATKDAATAARRDLSNFQLASGQRQFGGESSYINSVTNYAANGGIGLPGLPKNMSLEGMSVVSERTSRALDSFRQSIEQATKAVNDFDTTQQDINNKKLQEAQSSYNQALGINVSPGLAKGESAEEQMAASGKYSDVTRNLLNAQGSFIQSEDERKKLVNAIPSEAEARFAQFGALQDALVSGNAVEQRPEVDQERTNELLRNLYEKGKNVRDLPETLEGDYLNRRHNYIQAGQQVVGGPLPGVIGAEDLNLPFDVAGAVNMNTSAKHKEIAGQIMGGLLDSPSDSVDDWIGPNKVTPEQVFQPELSSMSKVGGSIRQAVGSGNAKQGLTKSENQEATFNAVSQALSQHFN